MIIRTDSEITVRRFARIPVRLEFSAAEYSSGGRTRTRTTSESSVMFGPGSTAYRMLTATSRTGAGRPTLRATRAARMIIPAPSSP